MDALNEIKSNLKEKNLIFGTERALKLLKLDKIAKVFLSKNTPESVEEDFNYYLKFGKVEVLKLEIPNDELGIFCKKQYPVSVIALLK